MPNPRPAIDRYMEKVDRSNPDGCWPWTAGTTRTGYGLFRIGPPFGRTVRAHRWGYEYFVGPIPVGHGVLHRCDNPPCQRTDHWFTGTQAVNVGDMVAKGRISNLRGEAHGSAKLTALEVMQIRERYSRGSTSQQSLADEFGVSRHQISRIVRHEQWA